jgi:hypothetical protein
MDTQDTGQTTTQHWAQKTQDKQHYTEHRRHKTNNNKTLGTEDRTNNNTTLSTEDTGQTTT